MLQILLHCICKKAGRSNYELSDFVLENAVESERGFLELFVLLLEALKYEQQNVAAYALEPGIKLRCAIG